MPYPNEHSCRIKEPGEFESDSFRRLKKGRLSIIIGKITGDKNTSTQAYRYPSDLWDEKSDRAHCSIQKGEFTAALKVKKD